MREQHLNLGVMAKLLVNLLAFTSIILAVEACTEADIRLVNGVGNYQGRVEVCHNNIWGTVCDDSWSSNDGIVACRQLGLRYAAVVRYGYFGQGTGQIWLDNLLCTGSETRLTDCRHNGFGIHNCRHFEDAGLFCEAAPVVANCTEGNIRLVNGPDNFEGRVEICHNNEWGTVCDNSWSANDGIVVCRQLGLSYVSVVTNAYYGQGEGQIWLEHLSCTGSENGLVNCSHNGFGVHSCGHHQDAGLVCNNGTSCVEGSIRLVGGTDQSVGRVEICHLNVWGSICSDSWSRNDGVVACHQLGLTYLGINTYDFHRQGSGRIWLSDVQCSGSETGLAIANCTHSGFDIHNCNRVAGVRCDDTNNTNVIHAPIRLTYGGSRFEGRVEVYYDGQWGTVCDDNWDVVDANVTCHQLGFGSAIRAHTHGYDRGSQSMPIWLDDVHCTTGDHYLSECSHNGWGNNNCIHLEDAGVVCSGSNDTCTEGDIRLMGGINNYEGRVEVCHNNIWGTVCDDYWSINDGIVACRQLGFEYVAITMRASFGWGSGQIWLDNLHCTGSESRLVGCRHNGFGSHNCYHGEDAGLICGTYGGLRLDNGTSSSGILNFRLSNGTWGTVCSHGFNWRAADVACKQLGYDYGDYTTCEEGDIFCHSSDISVAVCYTSCYGYETYLSSCYIQHHCWSTCSYLNYIRLNCYYYPHFYNYDGDSDGLSAGAITSIFVGSVISCITVVTLLIIAFVCVRRTYIKRRYRIHSITNPTLLTNESSEMVPPDFSPPPAYVSAPPSTVSYDQLVNDSDIVTIPTHSCDTVSESLPGYIPLNQPLTVTAVSQEDVVL